MSTIQGHDDVTPGTAPARRRSAAATLAAVPQTGVRPGPVAEWPAPDVEQRLVGMAQDLARAVAHGGITEQQAEEFLRRMSRRLVA